MRGELSLAQASSLALARLRLHSGTLSPLSRREQARCVHVPSPIQISNSHASSPVFFAGRRVRPYSLCLFLPLTMRGDGAPIGATIPDVHAFFSKAWRLSARHRGFSVPGAVLPGCDGTRAGSLIRAASAALRRRRVQPFKAAGHNAGGRLARASRVPAYEADPRAPHRRCRVYPISAPLRRFHHRDVSRRRPQLNRTRRG